MGQGCWGKARLRLLGRSHTIDADHIFILAAGERQTLSFRLDRGDLSWLRRHPRDVALVRTSGRAYRIARSWPRWFTG